MSPASKINQPPPSEANFHSGPEAPTKPGVYWFHGETASNALRVEVRVTNGKLMVGWGNQDPPITKLTASGQPNAPIIWTR